MVVKPCIPYFLVEQVCLEDCYDDGAIAVRIIAEPEDYANYGRWYGKTVFISGNLLFARTDKKHLFISESQIIAEVIK